MQSMGKPPAAGENYGKTKFVTCFFWQDGHTGSVVKMHTMETIVQEEIAIERRKGGTSTRVVAEIGGSMKELLAQCGEEVVFSHARSSIVLSLSTYVRNLLDAGTEDSEIQDLVAQWKPTPKKRQKTALDRMREELDKLSPADRLVLQKELRSRAPAAAE